MYCKKCGHPVEGKFCPSCGVPASVEIKQADSAETTGPTTEEASSANLSELHLAKRKMIAAITYKTIDTTIILLPSALDMEMKIKPLFRKEQIVRRQILYAGITNAYVHTTMDFWDLIYGIAFVVVGFFTPVAFLISAVCFFTGYGKEVVIELNSGERIQIPTASAAEANEGLAGIHNIA